MRWTRATRLCFILKIERADDDVVNLAEEAFVAHKCRFLTLAQFTTYVDFAILQKHLPPPVIIGWSEKTCQPEGSAENILTDLVSFARLSRPDAANPEHRVLIYINLILYKNVDIDLHRFS